MSTPYEFAWSFVASIAGDPNTAIIDWRAIHDTNKEVAAIPFRGTLVECWASIQSYNSQGYGIFANIAQMDGLGRELANVQWCRAHYVDLDNESAQVNFERAQQIQPLPSFAVQSSPGKYHVYWMINPYKDNDRFQLLQRKLRQFLDGDKAIVDASRVMRVPGTLHLKNPQAPSLVTCFALQGYGQRIDVTQLEQAMLSVNVIDGGVGVRHELGDPELAAPSLEWITYALKNLDPNDLDRAEWIAITSGIKQAGWTLTDPQTLFQMWSDWCALYRANDPGENKKQWDSIRNTELGWSSVVRRVPALRAAQSFGMQSDAPATSVGTETPPMPTQAPPLMDCSGEILTDIEQREWFKGCAFVVKLGKILGPNRTFMNQTQFNGEYGGKNFIINRAGKTTNEPWQAALRSTLWTIPKVNHTRFIPSLPPNHIVMDALGRSGVNMYLPAQVRRVQGDPSPFINHIAKLLPDPNDQKILLDYLAHNVKYPGYKIPWAPVIQSTEGAGKGTIKHVMTHALGSIYIYFPAAKELVSSGSQFNGWMRNRLMIIADEIKVDDRRDLIEVLKPMISEEVIDVQSKGVDQELEDNFANWLFFTNYKDAVPVQKDGRRYAIFYSALQSQDDKANAGMSSEYFSHLYRWLKDDGAAIVADYFFNYPIERGAIPMEAPQTSSWREALKISRSPIERSIGDAIEDGIPGFRNGWVSMNSVMARLKTMQVVKHNPAPYVIDNMLKSMGYVNCGRAPAAYFQETGGDNHRGDLYHLGGYAAVELFAQMQGWN